MKSVSIAALAAVLLAASAAQAAPVTYTISGAADGSFNGNAFTNAAFTFKLFGDTDDITNVGPNEFLDPLASSTVVIDGFGPFTLLAPTSIGHSTSTDQVVFNALLPGGLRNVVFWATATPVSIADAFGSVSSGPIVEIIGNTIATSGGDLVFNTAYSDTPITFSVSIGRVPDLDVVPEPSTWAMMLMGFGGLGATLRRRRALASA